MPLKSLYHGTCPQSANIFITKGWKPNQWYSGGNGGQPQFLYLSTDPHDAEWFSNQMGCENVVQVKVESNKLHLDPEDAVYAYEYWNAVNKGKIKESQKYIQKELSEFGRNPIKFVIDHDIPKERFSICKKEKQKWIC